MVTATLWILHVLSHCAEIIYSYGATRRHEQLVKSLTHKNNFKKIMFVRLFESEQT